MSINFEEACLKTITYLFLYLVIYLFKKKKSFRVILASFANVKCICSGSGRFYAFASTKAYFFANIYYGNLCIFVWSFLNSKRG